MKNSIPLKISELVKTYENVQAVAGVNLELAPGEIFGLLGPNGAGKTSIISCLVNLEMPTSGSCEIFGYDVNKDEVQAKLLTGFVPQELIHHGFFDVEEILKFHSGYYGVKNNKEQIDYLLHKLSLYDHRHKKVKALSGGMKRRLLIAKALVHKPKLLLLDEPTAGVDIELRESLWRFVQELKDHGTTVLLTTHYIEEAEHLCDRIGVLQRGKILTIGPTSELIETLTFREIIASFDLSQDVGFLKSSHYFVNEEQGGLKFRIPSRLNVGDFLKNEKIPLSSLVDLKIREGRLEEALKSVLNSREQK